jgi:hypothetical protein
LRRVPLALALCTFILSSLFTYDDAAAQRRAARRTPVAAKAERVSPRARKTVHPPALTLQDGSLVGQTWTGDAPIEESTATIMERERERAAALQPEQNIRPLKREHESTDRERLPQNPEALPGAQWPPFEETARRGDGVTERMLEANALAPQPVALSFTAATLADSGSFPPDSMGAVGITQFLLCINGRIRVFDKNTGQMGALDADLDSFFSSVRDGALVTDPRVRFDRLTNRWFVLVINYLRSGQLVLNNRICLAVSDGPTITATTFWRFYQFQHNTVAPTGTAGLFADYPTLAVDAHALYIGVNLFYANDAFAGCDLFVIRKSSVVSGGSLVAAAFRGLTTGPNVPGMFTPQGADNVEPNSATGYVIASDNAALGRLVLRRVSDPGGTPVLSPNLNINVLATSLPLKTPHLGNTAGADGHLDTIGDRLFAATVRNGRLWTAHNIGVDNRGAVFNQRTRNAARWYEIGDLDAAAPRMMQAGTVFADSATNDTGARHYFIPSLMVSGQGHMAMGFSTAGANEYINAGTVGRLANDILGTTRTPLLFTAAAAAYNPSRDPGDADIGRRWGDYSYTSLDPCDDMTMWTVQQFTDGVNSYGVKVAKLQAPPPAIPASANPPSVLAGQANVEITVTGLSPSLSNDGAGFYDPGEGFACRLNATVSGGVTVQHITYVNPSTLRLTVSTVGATPGVKNISVTNPDGQSVTGTGLLTVGDCTYSVAPTIQDVAATGASGTLNVTATTGCAWTALSQSSFVTITAGTSGNGNGTVSYAVAPNVNNTPRIASLIVAGQAVSLVQAAGAGCSYELTPATQSFLSYGGTATVSLATPNDCAWTPVPSDGWVSVQPGSAGRGNGTVTYSVLPNTATQSRVATLTLGNRNLVITQEAAQPELAIDDGSFERDSGSSIAQTIYRVNRLTPTSYPATLTAVAIYFSGRGGARTGKDFNLITGHNADGDNLIDNLVFQSSNQKISAVNEFSVYALPTPLTINAGDLVVGFRMDTTPDEIPLGFDNTNPAQRRSYRSDNGVSWVLTTGANDTPVNYGIRARLAGAPPEVIGFEADLAPRPSGNDLLTVTDWTLMGRFVAGLLTPALGAEFQRADCAPRETGGDGRLTAADFTQAGRYAAGLDQPTRASGPLAPLFAFWDSAGFNSTRVSLSAETLSFTRKLARNATLYVIYQAAGHENAISGTLRFNPQQGRVLRVTSALPDAQLILNEQALAQGQLGFVIARPSGHTLAQGEHKLFTLSVLTNGKARWQSWFDDSVMVRESADAQARAADCGDELKLRVR